MEYETYWVLQKLQKASSLAVLIREYTTRRRSPQQLRPTEREDQEEE